MGRTPKFTKEEKVKACDEYDSGKGSFYSIAKELGANKETIRIWYYSYKKHGDSTFIHSSKNRSYSKEFKMKVINEYLKEKNSISELGVKYNISYNIISKWINKYYNGIEIKDYDPKGDVYTMKSRKITLEERLKIVKWVIANEMNYKAAAENICMKNFNLIKWRFNS